MLGASCLGIVLPTSVVGATDLLPSRQAEFSATSWLSITDIALGKNGTLQGLVVDGQGIPVRGSPVLVQRAGREIARAASDQWGHFQITGLRGGVYQVLSAQGGGAFRLWAHGTAPPMARTGMIVVSSGNVVRGQMPFGNSFGSDQFILMSLIGAAIAIPVTISNNRSDPPSGS